MKTICRSMIRTFLLVFFCAGMGVVCARADSLSQGKLNELMQRFPDGKYWDHLCTDPTTTRSEAYQDSVTDHVCSHTGKKNYYDCNHFDGVGQCYGFARKMAYEYFGVYYSAQPRCYKLDKLKAGDLVRYHPGRSDHSIWVTAVNGSNVTYAECNYAGPCRISWNRTTTLEEIDDSFLYIEQAPDVKVMLDSSTAELYEGESVTLHASVTSGGNAAAETVYWRTSDSSVASVDPSGTVSGLKPGTAVVTAYLANDKAAADCTVTVKETGISLDKWSVSVYVGESVSLTATVSGSSQTVTWSSSKVDVAAVKDGKVTGKKAGSAVITAEANGKTANCTVSVRKPTIKLNKKSATIYTSGSTTVKLKAIVNGSEAKATWKSSNPSVATVNSKGKVTAKKKGTVTITAKANGKTAKCKVTVKKASSSWQKIDFSYTKTVKVGKATFSSEHDYLNRTTSWYATVGGKEGLRLRASWDSSLTGVISTDGSEVIYYEAENKKAVFYKDSVYGGKKKKIGTVNINSYDEFNYAGYCNGYIYYCIHFEPAKFYRYNIEDGKKQLLLKDCGFFSIQHKDCFILKPPEPEGQITSILYAYDAKTGRGGKITERWSHNAYACTDKYLYYVEITSGEFGIPGRTVAVKRCRHDGTGKKTLVNHIEMRYLTKFTKNSITYVDLSGKTKKRKF